MAVARRQCSKCGESRRSKLSPHRRNWCRKCLSARKKRWAKANAAHVKRYQRRWREAKRDHRAQSWSRWYAANRHRVLNRLKAEYAADPDASRARARRRYKRNRAASIRAVLAYQARNPDKRRAHDHHKRARKRALPHRWTAADIASALKFWKHRCAVCRKAFATGKVEWDHWIPITCAGCPGTVPENLTPMCQSCNRSKHNTPAEEWLKRRFPRSWQRIKSRIEAYLKAIP